MSLSLDLTEEQSARRAARLLIGVAGAIGVATAFVFWLYPELDLVFARPFFRGRTDFLFNSSAIAIGFRYVFQALFVIGLLFSIGAAIRAWLRQRRQLGHNNFKWLYVAACLAIGPGLVTNVLLKDNWGRARPFYVTEFGGPQKFTPPLVVSTSCRKNCSFVSGEASTMFMLFFALALALRRYRRELMATAVLLGLAAGLIRMGQGGHFLSDVIFAGVFMALLAAALRLYLMPWMERYWGDPKIPAGNG